jgi:hypothetical protein
MWFLSFNLCFELRGSTLCRMLKRGGRAFHGVYFSWEEDAAISLVERWERIINHLPGKTQMPTQTSIEHCSL